MCRSQQPQTSDPPSPEHGRLSFFLADPPEGRLVERHEWPLSRGNELQNRAHPGSQDLNQTAGEQRSKWRRRTTRSAPGPTLAWSVVVPK
jgi:hypothetical protein